MTLNVLPDSVRGPGLANLLHKLVNMLPLMGAQIGSEHLLSMIGVKDSTEEFDVLAHRPAIWSARPIWRSVTNWRKGICFSELLRPIGLPGGRGYGGSMENSAGLVQEAYSHDVTEVSGPFVLWSQYAQDRLLPEYIATRRWSPHKYLTELSRRGLIFGGATRAEMLNGLRNLYSYRTMIYLAQPKKRRTSVCRAVIGTVPAALTGRLRRCNRSSDWRIAMCAIPRKCCRDTGCHSGEPGRTDGQLAAYPERPDARRSMPVISSGYRRALVQQCRKGDFLDPGDTLYFSKISLGFLEALTELFMRLRRQTEPLTVNLPYTLVRRSDGTYLLCIYNTCEYYSKFHVRARYPIRRVTNVTDFPILPAKFFVGKGDQGFVARYEEDFPFSDQRREFYNRVAPDGVAVFIVELDGV